MKRTFVPVVLCMLTAALIHIVVAASPVRFGEKPSVLARPALAIAGGFGQGRGRGQDVPPPTPRAAAPIDLTGYWVSVVTEDWRWRMITPPKGDYTSVPLNPEGRKIADTWDPAKASSDGCKPFGGAAVMRVPGRLHITWDGDSMLKIETDAGTQTRFLHFDPSTSSGSSRAQSRDDKSQKPTGERTWQGWSIAEWETVGGGRGGAGRGGEGQPRDGSLKVVTTNMRSGYFRRNGVAYSDGATMTEYFDRHSAYGTDWFTVTTIVEDPQYLTQPFITSTHFKKEADATKFSPTACE
jgi:hypothetical protein